MRNNQSKTRRNKRLIDFPELQVGYPERNDVSNPHVGTERSHSDSETTGISRKTAARIARKTGEANVSHP